MGVWGLGGELLLQRLLTLFIKDSPCFETALFEILVFEALDLGVVSDHLYCDSDVVFSEFELIPKRLST